MSTSLYSTPDKVSRDTTFGGPMWGAFDFLILRIEIPENNQRLKGVAPHKQEEDFGLLCLNKGIRYVQVIKCPCDWKLKCYRNILCGSDPGILDPRVLAEGILSL